MSTSTIIIRKNGKKTDLNHTIRTRDLRKMIELLNIPRSDDPNSACTHLISCQDLKMRLENMPIPAGMSDKDLQGHWLLDAACEKSLREIGPNAVAHIYLDRN